MPLNVTDAHRQVINAGTAWTFTRLSVGTGNRAPDGTETALVTPFNPAREMMNPPGAITAYQRVVDWVDGFTGDTVAYTANELGLWATPAGGAEYLAAYESNAIGALFAKVAGQIFSHRAGIGISEADSVNGTFVVPAVPVATTLVAGVSRRSTDAEADAAENAAIANATLSPRGWWRMFTGARIVGRLAALTGNSRLPASAIRDLPTTVKATSGDAGAVEANASDSVFITPWSWWRMFTGARIVARLTALTGSSRLSYSALKEIPGAVVNVLVDAANIAWNFNSGYVATVTLGGNRTLSVPTNGQDSNVYLLRVKQDATGSRTLTLHASIDRGDLSAPALSTAGGTTDVLGFMKWGGTVHYLGVLKGY